MRLRVLLLLTILTVFFASTLYAQDTNNKVHNLYFVSVAYPEVFDDSLALDLALLESNEMLSCLVPLRNTYFQLAQAAINQCGVHQGNPQAQWECLKDDPSASLAFWADGIIAVLRQQIRWVDTFTGSNLLRAKIIAEQIQPGFWVQSVQMGMPLIQQMILCP